MTLGCLRLNDVFEISVFDWPLLSCHKVCSVYGDELEVQSVDMRKTSGILINLDSGSFFLGSPYQEIVLWDVDMYITKPMKEVSKGDYVLVQGGIGSIYNDRTPFPFWAGIKRKKTYKRIPLFVDWVHMELIAYIMCFGKYNKRGTRLYIEPSNWKSYVRVINLCEHLHIRYKLNDTKRMLTIKVDTAVKFSFDFMNVLVDHTTLPKFVWEATDDEVYNFVNTLVEHSSVISNSLFNEIRDLMIMRFGVFVDRSKLINERKIEAKTKYKKVTIDLFAQKTCYAVPVKSVKPTLSEELLVDFRAYTESIVNTNGILSVIREGV